jgi:hypothetical protein
MTARKAGFTLVEVLVATTMLVIFFGAVMTMIQMSLKLVGQTKATATAKLLLQERMELIRNMPYTSVGVIGGIPAGPIEPVEAITVNKTSYEITTSIIMVDDPYDGLAPEDEHPNDYKQVRISVSWGGIFASSKPIVVYTNVVPRGTESELGGGILALTVIDSHGSPVSNATVTIVSDEVVPAVNMTSFTDINGRLILGGATPCIECYQISATKTGYTSDRTYGRDEVENPRKPHASVIEGDTTALTYSIDLTATITFRVVRDASTNYSAFQGVQMRVFGKKEIGRTSLDQPVYKFDQLVTSGTGGVVTIQNVEWDSYTVQIPVGSSVDMSGFSPTNPFSIEPSQNREIKIVVSPASAHSLLVWARDNLFNPIASGSVELRNDAVPYIATQSTAAIDKPDAGQTWFSSLPSTLTPYMITLLSDGFEPVVTEATVSGDVIEQFILAPL